MRESKIVGNYFKSMGKKIRSDRKTFLGIKANGPVFLTSLIIIAIMVGAVLIVGKPMEQWFKNVQNSVSNNVGWFFIVVVNVVLFFSIFLGFSRFGKIKFGGEKAVPKFSTGAWFAMLFSAGMGIGLVFWSVAEPIFHFVDNPFKDANTNLAQSAEQAMSITYLHWGIHAWGLYALVGAALAYFTFNKKLPLTIRSIFYPLLGNKIYGPIGDIIDIISVLATLFGLATSLGLGVQQVNAGLSYLFDIENSVSVQVILIVIITFFATLSLVMGLDKGIRKLSEWNVRMAVLLLVFVLLVGPTLFLFKSFVQNIGYYLSNFFELSLWTHAYEGVSNESTWQNSWTIFYWAWWISWSPFVGIFIARISEGRTLKQFIFGVLMVPTLFTFLWLSVFGGSAIYQELIGNSSITESITQNVATAIYYLLEQYPLTSISSGITIVLVASFFVTSSDSGSFVVDTLTSGGRHDAPKGQKIFWASMEGLIASVLLIGGGLVALQTASILTGLPFAIILLIMCYSFYKSLNDDHPKKNNS